jgi:hypothetical protein
MKPVLIFIISLGVNISIGPVSVANAAAGQPSDLVRLCSPQAAQGEVGFHYPYYLLEEYDPDNICWKGMSADGRWPVPVVPQDMLVGPPPSNLSGVTIPIDRWIELQFPGRIVDGPGNDIQLIELGQVGEQALIFLTAGGKEYLLGQATASSSGLDIPTTIYFDISGISLPFPARAIRILALDTGGGSPGFDIANMFAQTYIERPLVAFNPVPFNGAKNVPLDVVLSWSPGQAAGKHIVYFGDDPCDVDADASPVDYPSQPQDANSFDPGGLELGRTYYWRVDEVNSVDPNNIITGRLWSFSVVDHLVIDDFESYDNSGNQIHLTWEESGGAYVSVTTYPAYKCMRSMAFDYYNRIDYYSEATITFDPPQDWVAAGGRILELFFYGGPGNDINTQIYLRLSDGQNSETVLYNDINDIRQRSWKLWRINIADLINLDLSHIETFSIGFLTEPEQPPQISRGMVFFDDIMLYTSRCFEDSKPAADLSGDCIVNFDDLKEMTFNWLDVYPRMYSVIPPKSPLAWYKFDENTDDSSGNSYHGWPLFNLTYVPGVFGQAIKFEGNRDSVKINNAVELFQRINTGITISFWQYGEDSAHRNDTLCCSNYEYGEDNPAIAINLGCWIRPKQAGLYNWDCGYPWSFNNRLNGDHKYKNEWQGRWNHWAFTKDINQGIMQIFLNGRLYDSRSDANSPISGITSFEIGSGWYGGYDGLIDDFRIYDYALSQPEVAYVATNGTGIFNPPGGGYVPPADLNGDNRIDFLDFAVLAGSWLDEQFYPPEANQ